MGGQAGRFVLGIAGSPGAGKSTVAEEIRRRAQAAGVSTVVVGMDGWHLAHSVLEARGQVDVKGAPETFDAAGFVRAMHHVRHRPDEGIWLPQFRREIEDAVAGAVEVRPEHRLVVVEGNYLLLDEPPWRELPAMFDAAWMLTPADDVRTARLVARHEQHGQDPEAARERALGSDERNARRVAHHRVRVSGVLEVDPG